MKFKACLQSGFRCTNHFPMVGSLKNRIVILLHHGAYIIGFLKFKIAFKRKTVLDTFKIYVISLV